MQKASRLPMRNWNYWRGINITSYPASRLPMRNWNREKPSNFPFFPLPDYLWGIETCDGYWTDKRQLGFQTTYEELKLDEDVEYHIQNSRFQTTYEELKLLFCASVQLRTNYASRLPMRNWNYFIDRRCQRLCRFQTTYEELKLSISDLFTLNSCASRLPMRNWNRDSTGRLRLGSTLPDYLWGIETFFLVVPHDRCTGFQTTYEELKQLLLF